MKKYLVFIIFLICRFGAAQNFENLGSVSTSLGGAGAGSVNAVDGAFNNPATFALFPYRSAQISSAKNLFRLSLADNGAEALFPAMLGYSQNQADELKNKTFYFGLALPFKSRFSLGLNVGFQESQFVNSAVNGRQKYRQNVVDVGALFRPFEWFSLGVVLKNKPLNDTELSNTIDQRSTVALGFESQYEDLVNLRAELEFGKNEQSDQRSVVKTGLEILMNQWIQLRLGYQNNNIDSQNYFTAGLGFGGPQFGLHYAYLKESEFEKETQHSIDLAVPF